MHAPANDVDPLDRATWPVPVESERGRHPVTDVNQYSVTYNVPMSPDILVIAIAQLPREVPRGVQTYLRTRVSKSNVARDGGHLGGFILEASWPSSDLNLVPLDIEDETGVEPSPKARTRRK